MHNRIKNSFPNFENFERYFYIFLIDSQFLPTDANTNNIIELWYRSYKPMYNFYSKIFTISLSRGQTISKYFETQ